MVFVHTEGSGPVFHAAIQARMSFSNACTVLWTGSHV